MRDLAAEALTALRTYIQRGRLAIDAFEQDEDNEADRLMKLRKAAFANFKVFEHKLSQRQIDINAIPEVQSLVADSFEIDEQLEKSIYSYRDRLNEKLNLMLRNRTRLSKYYSGRSVSSGFENSA